MEFIWQKSCLALDLATLTGVAHNGYANNSFSTYTVELATKKEITDLRKSRMSRRQDVRAIRCFDFLKSVTPVPDVVVFEDVEFSSYTQQTQLWASLRTAVWLAFREETVVECVPVATLKKFATNHGSATKDMMMRSLAIHYPSRFYYEAGKLKDLVSNAKVDDNAADATWLWLWAKHNLARLTKPTA